MINGQPFTVAGNTVSGAGLPLRGTVYGLEAQAASGGVVVVEGGLARLGAIEREALSPELYLSGVFVGNIDGLNQAKIPASEIRQWAELGPVPSTSWSWDTGTAPGISPMWVARSVGNRALLQWADVPAAPDFAAFVLYWDAGLNVTPATELAVITSPNELEYRSSELSAGVYRFAIAYRDAAGNESAIGSDISVRISPLPLAVTGVAIDYTTGTRTSEISFTPPASDPADVRAYLVFDNWIPGAESLAPGANSETGQERGVVYAAPGDSAQSFVTPELWPGVWRFAVRALTADGILGPATEIVLNLQLDGSDLIEAAVPPPAPVLLQVLAIANGAYTARVRLESETGLTQLWITEDGSEEVQITLNGSLEYTATGATRADGTAVILTARAKSSATVFTDSEPFTFTADAAPPTGDGIITGRATL